MENARRVAGAERQKGIRAVAAAAVVGQSIKATYGDD